MPQKRHPRIINFVVLQRKASGIFQRGQCMQGFKKSVKSHFVKSIAGGRLFQGSNSTLGTADY